jgi:prevent-host-death family protein
MRDLKNTVEIERRCAESGEPVFVTKNGYGKLVVMDIEIYERTIKQIYEAKLVNESLTEIGAGAVLLDGDEIKKGIMARYGKR